MARHPMTTDPSVCAQVGQVVATFGLLVGVPLVVVAVTEWPTWGVLTVYAAGVLARPILGRLIVALDEYVWGYRYDLTDSAGANESAEDGPSADADEDD